MDERPPLHRTTVEDLHESDLRRGTILAASASLRDVVEALDYKPDLAAVYVVDARDRYVGLVTRSDLAAWIDHNLAPTAEAGGLDGEGLADRISQAGAEEAVHPRSTEVAVEPSEPVEHALRRMIETGLPVVPVVDAEGSVLGELRTPRLLTHLLQDR